MQALPFQGSAFPLSSQGVSTIAAKLNLHVPEIWAVLGVETSGCGYLADRRPQILFERHVFHRLTNGVFDDGDISDPNAGGYGPRGAQQYDRLSRAIINDREAALQSTSWGLGQTMGFNYKAAGFPDVESMVAAMSGSEDAQLSAMGEFLNATGLAPSLQAHDWVSFARRYNGPNYAINRYDVRLNSEYLKYSSGALPDLTVRGAQLYLTYLGFHPGLIDGIAGEHTMAALAEFETRNGLQHSLTIDQTSITRLQAALGAQASGMAA
jgi:hypothetical protein